MLAQQNEIHKSVYDVDCIVQHLHKSLLIVMGSSSVRDHTHRRTHISDIAYRVQVEQPIHVFVIPCILMQHSLLFCNIYLRVSI